ncbi:MAG: DEAD/DEAH box helicase family protein, partial [Gammaproteobacteria bacterium]|nr:DEAD/DEAH box helicase family protein [Gammaproteobacteria bacterium]
MSELPWFHGAPNAAAIENTSRLAGALEVLPPACDVLRDYQREQIATIARALRMGYRRPIAQAPTGSGKTHEIAAIALAASQADLRVVILATRTRLVRQIHERLDAFGVSHGVFAAELPALRNLLLPVQVASADTMHRRCIGDGHTPLPAADAVIFDECHLAAADTRLKLLEAYPDAVRLGFSATPAKKSGRSLKAAFDCMIPGPSVAALIQGGQLVRPRIFNTPIVSADELKSVPKDAASDYAPGALGDLMSRPKLVGDVVGNWLHIANGKRSLVFACSKAHAAALVEEFGRHGIAAELLTDRDDEATREAVFARLESG